MADRVEVHVAELDEGLGGLHVVVPEPAGGDAGVRLGHDPLLAVGRAHAYLGADAGVLLDVLIPRHLGGAGVPVGVHLHAVPGGVAGKAVLVADPAHLGLLAALEEDAVVALELLDGLGEAFEIVILGVRARALGAVHPNLDELALVAVLLVAQDLAELAVVEGVVVILVAVLVAIGGLVDIPGGEVEAHVDVVLRAGGGELGQDVDLGRGAAHVVVGGRAVPDAEAVVVLGGDDQPLEACLLDHLDVAVRIERGQAVHVFGSRRPALAVVGAPFHARERVGSEVAECRQLFFGVLVLAAVGLYGVLLRGRGDGAAELAIANPCFCISGYGQRERRAESGHDGESRKVATVHVPPIRCCRITDRGLMCAGASRRWFRA